MNNICPAYGIEYVEVVPGKIVPPNWHLCIIRIQCKPLSSMPNPSFLVKLAVIDECVAHIMVCRYKQARWVFSAELVSFQKGYYK